MALRRILYSCACAFLLVVVVTAPPAIAGRLPPPVTAGAAAAGTDCHRTLTEAPNTCVQELIQAIYSRNKTPVSDTCCQLLACVREDSCASVLRVYCLPQETTQCPLPPSTSQLFSGGPHAAGHD